jgi:hypothetical protein
MEKRQSTGALQNVAILKTYWALAFWSAAVLRRFSVGTLTLHRREGRCYDSDVLVSRRV